MHCTCPLLTQSGHCSGQYPLPLASSWAAGGWLRAPASLAPRPSFLCEPAHTGRYPLAPIKHRRQQFRTARSNIASSGGKNVQINFDLLTMLFVGNISYLLLTISMMMTRMLMLRTVAKHFSVTVVDQMVIFGEAQGPQSWHRPYARSS